MIGSSDRRAQANVVGVALLLGVAVVGLGVLTASVGTVVESHAETADAASVTRDLQDVLAPGGVPENGSGTLAFQAGELASEPRELRVLDSGGLVTTVDADALVYRRGGRRVSVESGALLRGAAGGSRIVDPPSITVAGSGSERSLVIAVPALDADVQVGGSGGIRLHAETAVRHERQRLGVDAYRLAVETDAPGAWERWFADRNRSTTRVDRDGDGVPSVVATYGRADAHLVVHRVEVTVDG